MSVFDVVPAAPRDPILGITEAFKVDPNPDKVNLGVGVYVGDDGKVAFFDSVRKAERALAEQANPRGYLPISGMPSFIDSIRKLVFGPSDALGRTATIQSLSGTGALKVGADFIKKFIPAKVLISDPSWENHRAIFTQAGLEVDTYRYYDRSTQGLDAQGMLDDLEAAEPGTVVVLHACCHNPTGVDLSDEQWSEVAAVIGAKGLIPFIDMAYQGFSYSVLQDSAVVRAFSVIGVPVFVATSCSKNFGLYGERIGSLNVVTFCEEEAARVLSQLKVLARTNYSNPPTHGAALVSAVLADDELRISWEEELAGMRERIKTLRLEFAKTLTDAGYRADTSFISNQVGMFSYTGLSREQMARLREDHSVYGLDSGRICIPGLNQRNMERVAKAFVAVQ
ncbi:MAG: aspartate/tyrosine/aromatic aminotransferase [Propionibacteriaceae bacterium]|jgi:aromatic-amino-acid transaminase|nr:aspartate/tyrosine/aromatic aminotransferase [Propionibacteriaceae bacterium]